MQKQVTLYNVLFPIWFLLIFPIAWLVVLPVNFVIDSLVLLIALKLLPVEDIKDVYKKSVVKVWLCGFAADIAGAGLLFATQLDLGNWWYEYITSPVARNPFDNWYSFFYVLLAVALAGFLIYFFNTKFCFSQTDLTPKTIRRIALALAILTAPYVLLAPSQLTYSPHSELQFFTNHMISRNQQALILSLPEDQVNKTTPQTTEHDTEKTTYHIPQWSDGHVLLDGCNTAKKIRTEPAAAKREADCNLIFYNEYSETEDSVILPVWLEDENNEENAYIFYKDSYYILDTAATAKLKELIHQIECGQFLEDFQLIDDGKEDSPAPEKIFSDLKNDYYLPTTRSRHIFVQFDDGSQMDLLKALGTHTITAEALMEKGLELIVKPKP